MASSQGPPTQGNWKNI